MAIRESAIREKIFEYVKSKYGVEPDYPFPTAPDYPVLRHKDNRKWFALLMDVPRNRLGLSGEERVNIINVKLADPLFVSLLRQQPGYFRGYHIGGGNWITILLDGTVPVDDIFPLIDESFAVTAPKRKKR